MEKDWIVHFKNQGDSKRFLHWDINVKKSAKWMEVRNDYLIWLYIIPGLHIISSYIKHKKGYKPVFVT